MAVTPHRAKILRVVLQTWNADTKRWREMAVTADMTVSDLPYEIEENIDAITDRVLRELGKSGQW